MLSPIRFSLVGLLFITGAMVGCGSKPPEGTVRADPVDESSSHVEHSQSDQAAITEALAQLSPEDRLLAESQKFCAVATENPLGSMGTPLKIDVSGDPVFLCCAGCKSKALRKPEETLANVARLKSENSVSK